MHIHWRVRLHDALNSHSEYVIDVRVFHKVHLHIALTCSFSLHLQGLVEFIQLDWYYSRVRQFNGNFNALNVVSELVSMLVLELDRDMHWWSKWETHSLIHILSCQIVNISDENIKHDNLVTECLVLLDNDSDLALFVKCADTFIIDEGYYGRLHFFVLVSIRGVVIYTLLGVA